MEHKILQAKSHIPLMFRRLHEDATLPTRGTPHSAGLDIYALEDSEPAGKVKTGLAVEIPPGYWGLLKHRSSTPYKVRIGAIDSDYRGEMVVQLEGMRPGKSKKHVKAGERIAQLIIVPYIPMDPEWAEELSDTERGEGGFGSTGE